MDIVRWYVIDTLVNGIVNGITATIVVVLFLIMSISIMCESI